MLYLAGFNITIEQLSLQKDNILSILNDGSFVQFNNNSQKLSIFYQFLGLYALIQLLYAAKNTEIGFSIDILFNSLNKQLREYYNKENRLFIEKNATEAFLVDQSLALWVIAITILYFNVESIFEFYLPDIIQDVLYSLNQDYRNATTNKIVSSISNKTKEPIQLEVTSFDLLILVAALSRVNLLYDYFFDNDLSSINLFENIINQCTDEKLIVYEKRFLNGHLLIRNQCFFTLTSYLLHLTVTGNQSLNVVTTNYWKDNKGFIEEINTNKFSAEANYYGLITLASPEWSKGEYFYIQDNYKGNVVSTRADLLMIFVSLVIVFIINKKRKRIKQITI